MRKLRIKRLERLWTDNRPMCTHAFTLIIDGEMVQDDAACSCGGERITLVAAHEFEVVIQESSARQEGALLARTKSV